MPENPNISNAAARIIASLEDGKGRFIKAEWQSLPKSLAAHKGRIIRKVSKAVVRTGVAFANLAVIKDAVEAGEREEVGSLPWGEWAAFPYIIKHKGAEYVRLTLEGGGKVESRYEVDGAEVDAATFYGMLPKQSGGERPEVITVKLENLLALG
jgi:hypothetical protein